MPPTPGRRKERLVSAGVHGRGVLAHRGRGHDAAADAIGRGAVAHRRIKPQTSAALERQTGAKDVDTGWARMRHAPPRGTAEHERGDFAELDRSGNGGRLRPERDTAGL